MKDTAKLLLALAVLIVVAGCSGGGSKDVDPVAAQAARAKVKKASAGPPPGFPGAPR